MARSSSSSPRRSSSGRTSTRGESNSPRRESEAARAVENAKLESTLGRRTVGDEVNATTQSTRGKKALDVMFARTPKRKKTDRDRVYMGQLANYTRAEQERTEKNDAIRASGGDLSLLHDDAKVLTAKDRDYFRRRRDVKHLFGWRSTFENIVGLFAVLAFFLVIAISEHNSARKTLIWDGDCDDPNGRWTVNFAQGIPCVDKDSQRDDFYVLVCKCSIILISFLSVIFNGCRYIMAKKIAELRYLEPQLGLGVSLCVSPCDNIGFIAESIVLMGVVPPFVDQFVRFTEVEVLGGANYWLPYNNLNVLIFVRFWFLLRVMRNFSGYANQNVAYVGAMNGVDSTSIFFSFRMIFREYPVRFLLFTFPALVFVSTACLIMMERFAPSSSVKNWHDAMWCIVISISTVGFGDLYPATVTGRLLVVVFPVFFGTLLVTAFTAIFIVTTDLSPREHRVCKAVDNDQWTRRFKRLFAIAVQRALRRQWFKTRQRWRLEFKSMTDFEWNGPLKAEQMRGKRLMALKYRFSAREWVPGLSALLAKSLCAATAKMRVVRHLRPEEVDMQSMALFSSRMCHDFVNLVGKVALLEAELKQKKLHLPRGIDMINVPHANNTFQKVSVKGKFGDEHPIVVPEARHRYQRHFQALVPVWDTLDNLEERIDHAEQCTPSHFSVLGNVSEGATDDDRRIALLWRIDALERALRVEAGERHGGSARGDIGEKRPSLKRLSWLVDRVEAEMDIVTSLRTLLSRCALRRRKHVFVTWKRSTKRWSTFV